MNKYSALRSADFPASLVQLFLLLCFVPLCAQGEPIDDAYSAIQSRDTPALRRLLKSGLDANSMYRTSVVSGDHVNRFNWLRFSTVSSSGSLRASS